MLIDYKILNNFVSGYTYDVGVLTGSTISAKFLNIPINLTFNNIDNTDLINEWVKNETKKVLNIVEDLETIRYFNYDLKLSFRFLNTGGTYNNDYFSAGYITDDIRLNKNNFKRSFFRLYFYDSDNEQTQNLLTTEDIDVESSIILSGDTIPTFDLNRIYWLRNDSFFTENPNTNRTLFINGRFFNAKTGKIHRFFNIPTGNTTPISLNTYVNNQSWRFSQIEIPNPININNQYIFNTVSGNGANTTSQIIFSEYSIQ